MGFHQGKKARDAYEAFNEKAMADGMPVLAQTARVLERRTLGEKHFGQALQFLTDLQKAATLTIHSEFTDNPGARLADRMINLSLLYFALGRNQYGQVANSRYIPLTLSSTIRQDYVSYRTRPLPLTFASEHTEERFGFWMRQNLDYKNPAFMNTVMMALAIARPLERLIEQKYATEIPVSIPHEKGFFLGYLALSNPLNFVFQPGFVARARGENGQPDLRGFNGQILMPEWLPNVCMTIRTFVPQRNLSAEQVALHEAFTHIMEAPSGRRSLGLNLAGYTTGSYTRAKDDALALTILEQKLTDLVTSDLWERVHVKSIKHLPSEQMTREQGPS